MFWTQKRVYVFREGVQRSCLLLFETCYYHTYLPLSLSTAQSLCVNSLLDFIENIHQLVVILGVFFVLNQFFLSVIGVRQRDTKRL